MTTYQINDKFNFCVVKRKSTGEELLLTTDLITDPGQNHFSISPGGPTVTMESTMGGAVTHATGSKPRTITINLHTRSKSAQTLTKWMSEVTITAYADLAFLLTIGYRDPHKDQIITRTFQGYFKEIPEEVHGGGIHKQSWDFLGYEIA